MAKPALGRGLGALLGGNVVAKAPGPAAVPATIPGAAPAVESRERVRRVALESIVPCPFQPRKNFAPETLRELADSIKEQGIVQPLIVREQKGRLELIAAERRGRAAQLLGLAEVPVIVREADDRAVLELALIENLQRENLNPIEEAQGYAQLIDQFQLTQEQVAVKVGKSRVVVTNALRLMKLPPEIQGYLRDGRLSVGHAKAILAKPWLTPCANHSSPSIIWKVTCKQPLWSSGLRKAHWCVWWFRVDTPVSTFRTPMPASNAWAAPWMMPPEKLLTRWPSYLALGTPVARSSTAWLSREIRRLFPVKGKLVEAEDRLSVRQRSAGLNDEGGGAFRLSSPLYPTGEGINDPPLLGFKKARARVLDCILNDPATETVYIEATDIEGRVIRDEQGNPTMKQVTRRMYPHRKFASSGGQISI